MKKLINILLTICLSIVLFTAYEDKTNAASASSGVSKGQIAVGENVDFIVYVSKNDVTSGSISVSYPSCFTFVSGTWMMNNVFMKDFNGKSGVFAFSGSSNLSGQYFKLTLKANAINTKATISATVQVNKDENQVVNETVTSSVRIVCAKHTFTEKRVDATCTKNGTITRTCSVCGLVETQTLRALGHNIPESEITVKPTCTEPGQQVGKCTRCNQTVTTAVPAKGHNFSEWVVTVPSTCIQHGTQERTCRSCGYTETQTCELSEHIFDGSATVIQEATIYQAGISEGTCTVCGQIVQQTTQCQAFSTEYPVLMYCQEGVFLPGTEFVCQLLDPNSEQYSICQQALSSYGSNFVAIDMFALLDETKVQPNGSITITMSIPETMNDSTILVYVDEDGKVEICNCAVDKNTNTLTATIDHFSNYALVQAGQVIEVQNIVQEVAGYWIYISAGLGFLALLFLILFITKKSNKTTTTTTKPAKTKAKKTKNSKNTNSFEFK